MIPDGYTFITCPWTCEYCSTANGSSICHACVTRVLFFSWQAHQSSLFMFLHCASLMHSACPFGACATNCSVTAVCQCLVTMCLWYCAVNFQLLPDDWSGRNNCTEWNTVNGKVYKALCLCKQDQGGVIVEVLHPDPRTTDYHQLIEMLDCEVAALLRLDPVLATEAALRLVADHDTQAGHHQPVHLRSVKHTNNNMCELMSTQ